MCQKKPGLRCAAHTREAYQQAWHQFDAVQSTDNYLRLTDTENAYFKTPEGFQVFQAQMQTMSPEVQFAARTRAQAFQREMNLRSKVMNMIQNSTAQESPYNESSNRGQVVTALRTQLDEQIKNQLLTREERQPSELDTDFLFIDVEDDTPIITDDEFLRRIQPTVDRLAALENSKSSV